MLTKITRNTEYKNVIWRIPQGLILTLLLFLIFINDLCNSTPLLEAIMLADNTNLFYSRNNVKQKTVNPALSRLNN